MQSLITALENKYTKDHVIDVRSGDVIKVHQRITEGSKSRIQIFEGLVIRTKRKNSATSTISVRRIASGVGVEKTFLLHSPLIEKVEIVKRSKVRRSKLYYIRRKALKQISKRMKMMFVDITDEVKETEKPEQSEAENASEKNTEENPQEEKVEETSEEKKEEENPPTPEASEDKESK